MDSDCDSIQNKLPHFPSAQADFLVILFLFTSTVPMLVFVFLVFFIILQRACREQTCPLYAGTYCNINRHTKYTAINLYY